MLTELTRRDDVRIESVRPEIGSSKEAKLEAIAGSRLQRAVAHLRLRPIGAVLVEADHFVDGSRRVALDGLELRLDGRVRRPHFEALGLRPGLNMQIFQIFTMKI